MLVEEARRAERGPVRSQTLIAVRDVKASSAWYQRFLGVTQAGDPDHPHRLVYDRLMAGDALVLQLQRWDDEDHPNLFRASRLKFAGGHPIDPGDDSRVRSALEAPGGQPPAIQPERPALARRRASPRRAVRRGGSPWSMYCLSWRRHAAVPKKSFSLKEVASTLGVRFPKADIDGRSAPDWWREWLGARNKNVRQRLLT